MDWRTVITSDPETCHGRPRFVGTRVPVSVVLDNLAAGVLVEEILRSYPSLRPEHVQSALAYAAELARDRVIQLPPKVA